MQLSGKRIAVLAENLYEDLELWYPALRMQEEGAEVKFVGTGSGKTVKSKHDYPVNIDVTADEVSVADFDAVIVPGGYSPDLLRRYNSVLNFVRDMNEQGKMVAAICHAGWVLASAEIVDGKTMTSVSAIKDDLIHAGANWVDEEVVRDGNLITSRLPKDLPAFCREIIAVLSES
jgi:protease I